MDTAVTTVGQAADAEGNSGKGGASSKRGKNRRSSWVALTDNATGRTYFHDDPELGGSGVTQWETPTEGYRESSINIDSVGEVASSDVGKKVAKRRAGRRSSWVAHTDMESGRTYYHDSPELGGTGETTWAKPGVADEEIMTGKVYHRSSSSGSIKR